MKYDPANRIQDLRQFGEFGDVNPSITDSSTYTFLKAELMEATFHGEAEGCFLYSRHWNPTNRYLAEAMALEGTELAWITASGMAAITCSLFQLCNSGDHIITSVTTYGGTYAFLKNYLPKFGIEVSFVNITDLKAVENAIKPNTKCIYTESLTNPLLQVSDIPRLAAIAHRHNILLLVDNTFSPMILSPAILGADIVVYSMTKFINGKNDCVAGAICGSKAFINALSDVNSGTAMLLGPVLDPLRSSSILKNLNTLHIRMKQHSKNADFLARRFAEEGIPVIYPGLPVHPQHELMRSLMNEEYGFGGMLAIDLGTHARANEVMQMMQMEDVGYLAVSLGYFKTLFSASGKSTSSEIPEEEQRKMGLSEGLVRFSVGLDNDIERTWTKIRKCLVRAGII
ncbi:MAG TPA: aminotransferase class I/II-fold pyridoxal phosphate-dependent enzyme [Bacteroidales bacterium]|nr:aminotransferase class I/II-fold pyridoxal phosphate-dependent enzyme [Bacteroidales bacterium]